MSCLPPHKLCRETGIAGAGRSSGIVAGKPSGRSSGKASKRQQARTLRATFRDDWQEFITSEFLDPADVADEFACGPDTADNWWHGRTGPEASFVRLAFKWWPERAAAHLLKGLMG
jgi:hypothetical protein